MNKLKWLCVCQKKYILKLGIHAPTIVVICYAIKKNYNININFCSEVIKHKLEYIILEWKNYLTSVD